VLGPQYCRWVKSSRPKKKKHAVVNFRRGVDGFWEKLLAEPELQYSVVGVGRVLHAGVHWLRSGGSVGGGSHSLQLTRAAINFSELEWQQVITHQYLVEPNERCSHMALSGRCGLQYARSVLKTKLVAAGRQLAERNVIFGFISRRCMQRWPI
jgi:hypothetical protein